VWLRKTEDIPLARKEMTGAEATAAADGRIQGFRPARGGFCVSVHL
jgi:hypothetical protein